MTNISNGTEVISLGLGLSSTSGTAQTALDYIGKESSGAASQILVAFCSEEKKLKEIFDVSFSRKISIPKAGGYSDKLSLYQSLNFKENSLCIVVKATRESRTIHCDDIYLKDDLTTPSTTEAVNQFCRRFGDSYISSITHGAEYYAIYSYQCSSRDEKLKLEAKIKASGAFEGIVVSADASSKFNVAISKIEEKFEFQQRVIGSDFAIPKNQDVIQSAYDFLAHGSGTVSGVIRFQTTGYESIFTDGSLAESMKALRENRRILLGSHTQEGLLAKESRLLRTKYELSEIEKSLKRFGCELDANALSVQSRINKDLEELQSIFDTFETEATTNINTANLHAGATGWPTIRYKEWESKLHGGGGGHPYRDLTAKEFISRGLQVTEIALRGERFVDQIVISYSDASGRLIQYTHGRPNGNQTSRLSLGEADYVTEITTPGSDGNCYVDSLRIKTKRTPEGVTVGGNTSNMVNIFSVDNKNKYVFVGFHGRCDTWNDAIGAIYLEFEDIQWV